MVFQKKGPMKGKQQTPSFKAKNIKSFEEMNDDLDSEDESSEDETIGKTPDYKSPKGKQVESNKKVNIQSPGKKTPGKNTPKSGDKSLVGEKQRLSHGSPAVKEFKGMMAKNTPSKNGKAKMQHDAAADDDDDDDDDDDEEEDDDDDESEDDVDLDMLVDDDDEEDDDDDDDDDEEDDDEEEEEPPKKKQNNKSKQKNVGKVKTPIQTEKNLVKSAEKPKSKDKTVSKTSPGKKMETATPAIKKAIEVEQISRRERDIRTLYVGNLPKDILPAELQALSSDIIHISIPQLKMNNSYNMQKRVNVYAFLEFASESKAEENFKALQKKKLRGEPLKLDFAGEKSRNKQNVVQPESTSNKPINLKRLYVSSLPADVTINQIAKLFPKSFQITLGTNPAFRTATVYYMNEKDAAQELKSAKGTSLSGVPITILYSLLKVSKKQKKKRRKNKAPSNENPAKRMKVEVKQDSDDDDDDDDDDEEED